MNDDLTTSDHSCILFDVLPVKSGDFDASGRSDRFALRGEEWTEEFDRKLSELGNEWELCRADSSCATDVLQEKIMNVCSASLLLVKPRRRVVPWWTPELTRLRRGAMQKRGDLQRKKRNGLVTEIELGGAVAEYHHERNVYKECLLHIKTQFWQDYVKEEADRNPWGMAYRFAAEKVRVRSPAVTVERLGGGRTVCWLETVEAILEGLIPRDDRENESPEQQEERVRMLQYVTDKMAETGFTTEELQGVAKSEQI